MKTFVDFCVAFSLLQILNGAGAAPWTPWNTMDPLTNSQTASRNYPSNTQKTPISTTNRSTDNTNWLQNNFGPSSPPPPPPPSPEPYFRSANDMTNRFNFNPVGNQGAQYQWPPNSGMKSMAPAGQYAIANSPTMYADRLPTRSDFPTNNPQKQKSFNGGGWTNDFTKQPTSFASPSASTAAVSDFGLAAAAYKPETPAADIEYYKPYQKPNGEDTNDYADPAIGSNSEIHVPNETRLLPNKSGELVNNGEPSEITGWYKESRSRAKSRSREAYTENKTFGPNEQAELRKRLEKEIQWRIAQNLRHQ